MILELTFPLPPTLNKQINLARSHWSQSSKTKKAWTNKLAALCFGSPSFPGQIWMEFQWQVKRIVSDPDNISASSKYILDGLVEAGIIIDDSLKIIQSPIVHWYEKGNNQVIVTLSDNPEFMIKKVCPTVTSPLRESKQTST